MESGCTKVAERDVKSRLWSSPRCSYLQPAPKAPRTPSRPRRAASCQTRSRSNHPAQCQQMLGVLGVRRGGGATVHSHSGLRYKAAVSSGGFERYKSFIVCRVFTRLRQSRRPLSLAMIGCSDWAVKSDKVLQLRQYPQTPIDPTGMTAYSTGNKQTKQNKQLGGELH